jgi:hypothetical protein
MAPKSGVLFKKWLQKVEHLLFRFYKVSILVLKRESKSGATFRKWLQKVEYLFKNGSKKWSTYIYIRGFRGLCPPNQMYFGWISKMRIWQSRGQGFALDSKGS